MSSTPPFAVQSAYADRDRRDCTVAEIAADFGVTRQTVYRALERVVLSFGVLIARRHAPVPEADRDRCRSPRLRAGWRQEHVPAAR
jgi:hypothetical protein